ncbi:DUF6207 family protein [Streptomyces sp. NPDC046197]|uniref:DUF6207 family protein n=1 Tax=Streptomyces sp. NPDC046197 TaxID=3154337 RepID=UPI0033C535CE
MPCESEYSQNAVAQMWATAPADRTIRDPGQPGVRIRLYAGPRQAFPLPGAAGAEPSSTQ